MIESVDMTLKPWHSKSKSVDVAWKSRWIQAMLSHQDTLDRAPISAGGPQPGHNHQVYWASLCQPLTSIKPQPTYLSSQSQSSTDLPSSRPLMRKRKHTLYHHKWIIIFLPKRQIPSWLIKAYDLKSTKQTHVSRCDTKVQTQQVWINGWDTEILADPGTTFSSKLQTTNPLWIEGHSCIRGALFSSWKIDVAWCRKDA